MSDAASSAPPSVHGQHHDADDLIAMPPPAARGAGRGRGRGRAGGATNGLSGRGRGASARGGAASSAPWSDRSVLRSRPVPITLRGAAANNAAYVQDTAGSRITLDDDRSSRRGGGERAESAAGDELLAQRPSQQPSQRPSHLFGSNGAWLQDSDDDVDDDDDGDDDASRAAEDELVGNAGASSAKVRELLEELRREKRHRRRLERRCVQMQELEDLSKMADSAIYDSAIGGGAPRLPEATADGASRKRARTDIKIDPAYLMDGGDEDDYTFGGAGVLGDDGGLSDEDDAPPAAGGPSSSRDPPPPGATRLNADTANEACRRAQEATRRLFPVSGVRCVACAIPHRFGAVTEFIDQFATSMDDEALFRFALAKFRNEVVQPHVKEGHSLPPIVETFTWRDLKEHVLYHMCHSRVLQANALKTAQALRMTLETAGVVEEHEFGAQGPGGGGADDASSAFDDAGAPTIERLQTVNKVNAELWLKMMALESGLREKLLKTEPSTAPAALGKR